MEMWLWTFVGILAGIVVFLLAKIYVLRKSAREIADAFVDKLTTDTNTLIDISSRDRSMCRLASVVNDQLRKLRADRHRFQQGDLELKNAVTNISHDLRTPLTAIYGYLDLLEQEEKTETVERYLKIIQNRTEMLTQLTEELFQYSVIITKEPSVIREPVVINRVLEECVASFYASFRACGIVPEIRMPEKPIVRMLDTSALSRIFMNLLKNVVRYSDGDLQIILSESGEIVFENEASGLNKVQVGRLFDRFYTVENARNSTGLGLAIVRTLTEQLQGTISAEYENNRLRINIFFN